MNGHNLNNVKCETNRTLRSKRRAYLKDKINELETNSKNKNIRDLCRCKNEFRKGYKPRINLVKDENDDLLADFNNILHKWKNYVPQMLNVHSINNNRQTELHKAEPLNLNLDLSRFKLILKT
jgi:hypothetical protein